VNISRSVEFQNFGIALVGDKGQLSLDDRFLLLTYHDWLVTRPRADGGAQTAVKRDGVRNGPKSDD
jgi:hypothetical protein